MIPPPEPMLRMAKNNIDWFDNDFLIQSRRIGLLLELLAARRWMWLHNIREYRHELKLRPRHRGR